jgi:hypothetical protein
MGIWCMFSGCPFVTSARDGSRSIAVEASGTGRLISARMPRTATFRLTNSLRIGNCWSWRALHAAANKVAIPDFRGYASYFYKNKLKEAVGAAFGRYENKLDEVRDSRGSALAKKDEGNTLVCALFKEGVGPALCESDT